MQEIALCIINRYITLGRLLLMMNPSSIPVDYYRLSLLVVLLRVLLFLLFFARYGNLVWIGLVPLPVSCLSGIVYSPIPNCPTYPVAIRKEVGIYGIVVGILVVGILVTAHRYTVAGDILQSSLYRPRSPVVAILLEFLVDP